MKQNKLPSDEEPLKTQTFDKNLSKFKKVLFYLQPKKLLLNKVKRTNPLVLKFTSGSVKSTKYLSQAMNRITRSNKTVKKLSLFSGEGSMCNDKTTDKDLNRLIQSLKRLKTLKRIELYLYNCQISEIALNSFSKGLKRLSSLENLDLYFQYKHKQATMSVDFSSLEQSVKTLLFLKEINLYLENYFHPIQKGIKKHVSILNRLSRLENIYLNLPRRCYSQITDQSLQDIQLNRLASLRKVYLDLESCTQITFEGISFLTQVIGGLSNLQSLDLRFSGCHELDDLAGFYIWDMIRNLPSLKTINLNFENCGRMTDAGLHIMSLNDLLIQEFLFNVGFCHKITDRGVIKICQALRRFTSLKALDLSFQGCKDITDHGVKELFDCIKKMNQLRSFRINLTECKEITDLTQENFIEFLKAQSFLEEVNFYSYDNPRRTTEYDKIFNKQIKDVKRQKPNLEVTFD